MKQLSSGIAGCENTGGDEPARDQHHVRNTHNGVKGLGWTRHLRVCFTDGLACARINMFLPQLTFLSLSFSLQPTLSSSFSPISSNHNEMSNLDTFDAGSQTEYFRDLAVDVQVAVHRLVSSPSESC